MRASAALSASRALAEPASRAANDHAGRIVLRRTGARPLCFHGALLHAAEADGGTGQTVIRLALYLCGEAYAASLAHVPVPGFTLALAWHRAEICPTLESALAVFETAQPPGDDGVAAPGGANSAILHYAAERVERDAALLHAFRNAVGGFLWQLCQLHAAGEPPR